MASIFDILASQLGDDELGKIANQIGADKGRTQDAISMSLPAMIEALGRRAEQASPSRISTPRPAPATESGSLLDVLNDVIGHESSDASFDAPVPPSHSAPRTKSDAYGDILPPTTPVPSRKPAPPAQPTSRPAPPTPASPSLGDLFGQIFGGATRQASPGKENNGIPDVFGDLLGNKQGRVSDAVSQSSGLSKDQAGSLISMLGPILAGALGKYAEQNRLSSSDLSELIKNDRAKIQSSPAGGLIGKILDQDGDGDFDMSDMLKLGMGAIQKK